MEKTTREIKGVIYPINSFFLLYWLLTGFIYPERNLYLFNTKKVSLWKWNRAEILSIYHVSLFNIRKQLAEWITVYAEKVHLFCFQSAINFPRFLDRHTYIHDTRTNIKWTWLQCLQIKFPARSRASYMYLKRHYISPVTHYLSRCSLLS